jgi:hypothetical protein
VIAQNGQEVPLVNIPGRNVVNKLPSANTIRWTIRRKVEIVAAVRSGLLTLDEACQRYRLSAEEFLHWERLIAAHGLRGLKATQAQAVAAMWAQRQSCSKAVLGRKSGPDAPKGGPQSLIVDPFAGDKRDR